MHFGLRNGLPFRPVVSAVRAEFHRLLQLIRLHTQIRSSHPDHVAARVGPRLGLIARAQLQLSLFLFPLDAETRERMKKNSVCRL